MKIIRILAVIITATLMSCSGGDDSGSTPTPNPMPTGKSLKETATFPIGVIVSASKLNGSNNSFTGLLNKEFNSVTAENDMKMAAMFSGPDTYDFSKGDAIVAYAKEKGLRVHGHALIWHSSIPSWLKTYAGTDAEFEAQIKGYIKATVAHFALIKTADGKPVVASWDVVNEAFTNEALEAVFYKRMGADYVAKCFTWAREADANVKLFYNDYNLEFQTSKVASVIDMVNTFKTKGTPIDGIGMQMHVDYTTSMSALETNLTKIKNTGLLIHFSELDMTVNLNKALTTLTQERAATQKAKYKEIAILYKTIPAAQRYGITFWGLRDNDSWLLNFYNNPNEWPLLFDSNYGYKTAYTGFSEGLQ